MLAYLQVRLAWVSAAVIVAARSTEYVPVKVAALVHLLAWGLWMGSNIWTTFAVGITMFKNMPVRVSIPATVISDLGVGQALQ